MPYQFDPNRGYVPSGQGYAPLEAYNQNYDPVMGRQGPTGGVGSNPYPYNRYAYSGPQFNGYGMPNQDLYGGYDPYYGNAIDAMAIGNRNMAQAGGLSLGKDLYNYANFQYGQAGNFQDQQNSAWNNIAQGGGGYTDAQKEAILNNPYLQNLQMSPEQAQSNYMTEGEQQGFAGNPMAAFDYTQGMGGQNNALYGDFRNQIGQGLGSQEASINSALQGAGTNMRNVAYDDSSKTYQDLSDIAALTRGSVGSTRSGVEGQYGLMGQNLGQALGSQAGAVRSYIDPRALTTSPEYQSTYGVGPQDMQGIVNQAGRSVGAQSAMDEERLQQQANASGNVSPIAMAAARDKIRQTGAVNQANTMADAAIRAKQLQLTTEQQRENTRLGAEQSYAGLGSGAEMGLGSQQVGAAQQYGLAGMNAQMGLGQQGLQNEQYMGTNTLGQQGRLSASQLGAEQYLASQNLAGQQYLGGSRLSNTQQLMGAGLQQGQFSAGLGAGALQTGEQQQSGRAGALASNRQGVNQYNQGQQFGRGSYIYGQGAQANTNFANNQQTQEQQYRDYLANAQGQANQNAAIGNQQRITTYGAMNTGMQGATEGAIKNYAVPGGWQAIANTAINAVRGAKGGVTKGPVDALIGEAGPELVVDLEPAQHGLEVGGFDPNDYASTMYGAPPIETNSDRVPLTVNTPDAPAPKKKRSPLYDQLLRGISPLYNRVVPNNSDEAQALADSRSGGGSAVGNVLRMAGFAEGGVTSPHHYFGSRSKLKNDAPTGMKPPNMRLVTSPQVTTLGLKGAQAIVPLVKKPGNKVNLSDIPALISKYGGRKA